MRASQLELTAHRLGCRSLAARIAERRPRPALADPLVPRSPGRRPPGPHRPHRRGGGGGGRGAAGRHPGHRQRRRRRHGAGVAAGRRHPGRGAADAATPAGWRRWRSGRCRTAPRSSSAAAAVTARCGCGGWPTAPRSGSRCAATPAGWTAVAVGALPDGTPVIVSGGGGRHGAGVAAGRRRPGREAADAATRRGGARWRSGRCRTAPRSSSAAAAATDRTVRVWRLADGTPVGEPLTGHTGAVDAVAVGAAAGRHPGHRQRRRRRHGAGVAAGRRRPGRRAADRPRRRGGGGGRGAAGRHPGHRLRRTTARCGCGGWPTAPRSASR